MTKITHRIDKTAKNAINRTYPFYIPKTYDEVFQKNLDRLFMDELMGIPQAYSIGMNDHISFLERTIIKLKEELKSKDEK